MISQTLAEFNSFVMNNSTSFCFLFLFSKKVFTPLRNLPTQTIEAIILMCPMSANTAQTTVKDIERG